MIEISIIDYLTLKNKIMEKYKDIIDFYLKNWIKLWNYETICINDVWFNYWDIIKLHNLVIQQELFIKSIEVFLWENIEFYPPDFYYNWFSKIENYKLVKDFLDNYNKNNNLYFTLFFDNSELENHINSFLIEKYKDKILDKEKKERKKRWWEFIDE